MLLLATRWSPPRLPELRLRRQERLHLRAPSSECVHACKSPFLPQRSPQSTGGNPSSRRPSGSAPGELGRRVVPSVQGVNTTARRDVGHFVGPKVQTDHSLRTFRHFL